MNTEHKFEPFDRVLVRDHVQQKWKAHFFSHMDGNYFVTGDSLWQYCIPYTPETAHLLGTSQTYEPPKPPHEYKWGDKVEVFSGDFWLKGLYVGNAASSCHHVLVATQTKAAVYDDEHIRPLHDTADTVKCGICGKAIDERTAACDVDCGPCCPEHCKDDTAAH